MSTRDDNQALCDWEPPPEYPEYSGPMAKYDLPALAVAIHHKIETVKKDWLKLGEMFTAARAKFPGDREFGKWCSDNAFDVPRNTRHALMRVYARFGSSAQPAEHKQLGWSTLLELVNVPDAEAAIDEGVTKAEAREVAKAGSFEQWQADKVAAREAAVEQVVTDPEAPSRARAAADEVLARQQNKTKIIEAKGKLDPDSAYHDPVDQVEDRLQKLQERAYAENPGMKQELQRFDDQKANAISLVNATYHPTRVHNRTDDQLEEAFAAWQWLLTNCINGD